MGKDANMTKPQRSEGLLLLLELPFWLLPTYHHHHLLLLLLLIVFSGVAVAAAVTDSMDLVSGLLICLVARRQITPCGAVRGEFCLQLPETKTMWSFDVGYALVVVATFGCGLDMREPKGAGPSSLRMELTFHAIWKGNFTPRTDLTDQQQVHSGFLLFEDHQPSGEVRQTLTCVAFWRTRVGLLDICQIHP